MTPEQKADMWRQLYLAAKNEAIALRADRDGWKECAMEIGPRLQAAEAKLAESSGG